MSGSRLEDSSVEGGPGDAEAGSDFGDRDVGCFEQVRIPVKWAPGSGDAGRRRSEATLVESYSIQVAHIEWNHLPTSTGIRKQGANSLDLFG
jgi:hypothetical protein